MHENQSIAIIGAGPAGLMAAHQLAQAGIAVDLYDRSAMPARKFLLAGRGGLNLTHSEALADFISRYDKPEWITHWLNAFSPRDLCAFIEALGEPVFIGSSGRVFPRSFKASHLLRKWLARLNDLGVRFFPRHELIQIDAQGRLTLRNTQGEIQTIAPRARLLALGGASWPKLGSDGHWVEFLRAHGVAIVPLAPANCGFRIAWSDWFKQHFAGQPLKTSSLHFAGQIWRGGLSVSAEGLEGAAIYAASRFLRSALVDHPILIDIDLRPDVSLDKLQARLATIEAGQSLSSRLRKKVGLDKLSIALLREDHRGAPPREAKALAQRIKQTQLPLTEPFAIERAISSAGGIAPTALTPQLELKQIPGMFAAGEMLDWEAPTGGYLLQACFASGVVAAQGIIERLKEKT